MRALWGGSVKKQLLAIGIALAAAGTLPAIAADVNIPPSPSPLADFPIVSAPPPRPVFTWTGCYLGLHAGGGFGDQQFTGGPFTNPVVPSTFSAPNSVSISSASVDVGTGGVLGGGQVGCDVQLSRNWLIGVAADGSWANISGGTQQNETIGLIGPITPAPTNVTSTGTLNAKTNLTATVTGRFGYVLGPGLFYAKGGVAWERTNYSFNGVVSTTSCSTFVAPNCTLFNPTVNQFFNFGTPADTRIGWTAGIGTEWLIGSSGWSVFGEYNFLGFGTSNLTFTDPTMGSYNFNVRQYINEGELGFNYRFGPSNW
jgi:outer membrane immunogenic protein